MGTINVLYERGKTVVSFNMYIWLLVYTNHCAMYFLGGSDEYLLYSLVHTYGMN